MTQLKHTPGPWMPFEVQMHDHKAIAIGNSRQKHCAAAQIDESVVCLISPVGLFNDEDMANSKLIASAPDLLEACISALSVGEIQFESCALSRDVKNKLQKAIKKAIE
jgi:hypothetical protein